MSEDAPMPQLGHPIANMIRAMVDGHWRRGLGGQTGGYAVRCDWLALAAEIEKRDAEAGHAPNPQNEPPPTMTTEELIREYAPWELTELCARCGCHVGWHEDADGGTHECHGKDCKCFQFVHFDDADRVLGNGWQDKMHEALANPSESAITIFIQPVASPNHD